MKNATSTNSTDPWGGEFYISAWNTIKASRWKVLCARLFGKRFEGRDGKTVVIGYQWRGIHYLTDFRHE